MSHVLIFRDEFENMKLVTIKDYTYNYQRQAVINEERMAISSKGWNYAACYETDNNKTYLVFTKDDVKQDSGRLPIYC